MVTVTLIEGNNTISWSSPGYEAITAVITISSTGAISCKNSTAGCYTIPGVTISGTTVTAHMKALAVTPTPTPTPASSYCAWITQKGGWKNASSADIMDLLKGYSNAINLGFTVTTSHIMAHVAYYSQKSTNNPSQGNNLSGCNFT